jgi:hypothetical protein
MLPIPAYIRDSMQCHHQGQMICTPSVRNAAHTVLKDGQHASLANDHVSPLHDDNREQISSLSLPQHLHSRCVVHYSAHTHARARTQSTRISMAKLRLVEELAVG